MRQLISIKRGPRDVCFSSTWNTPSDSPNACTHRLQSFEGQLPALKSQMGCKQHGARTSHGATET